MNHSWIRWIAALALAAVLMHWAWSTPARAQEPDQYLPAEVVVKLVHSADLAGVAADHALDPTPLDRFGQRAIYRLRILDGAAPPDRAAALADDPRVVFAEPNFRGRAPEGQQQVSWAKGGDGEAYAEQWAVGMIRLPEAHTMTRGAGVTIAVLDSGVDAAHPALAGRLVEGYDFVDLDDDPGEAGAPGQNAIYGHGTHVAGLIALVAPEANIMPVRVLDPDGVSNIWVIAEALAYAMNPDGDFSTADGVDVINLSLSTDYPTNLLAEIVTTAPCEADDDQDEADEECFSSPYQRDVVVTAAVGNSGSSAPEYPAAESLAGTLAVGASTPEDMLAPFSNYGSWMHVTAPGVDILSTIPGGEYGVWSGTSMATPLAAGVAALLRSADPSLPAEAVVERVIAQSAGIGGYASRRIDAAAALGLSIVGEYHCTGVLGAFTVDNLLVPAGSQCTLDGTRIKGGLKVEASASIQARGLNVKGGVQIKGAAAVDVGHSTILGTVQVEESQTVRLEALDVRGDVQIFKNTGSLTITANTIGKSLQCKDNSQIPTGGGNHVGEKKEEQCSGL